MRIWTLIAALVLGTIAANLMAQEEQAAAPSARPTIGVVDVGHILKNHPTMKSDIERIETEMKAADEEMTRRRDEILKQMEELREKYVEGTPEYDREEKRIAEMDTQFRLEIVKRRKDFDKRRAEVLYMIFADIKTLVKFYSENMGIQLVLRVNGTREELDSSKPETVQLLMSQEVIHFASTVDMTQWVLDNMPKAIAMRQGSGAQTQR